MTKCRPYLLTIIFCLTMTTLFHTQSNWQHFIAKGDSRDVAIYDNSAYIANASGLFIIDLATQEETIIHPGNHTVTVQGFREIEMLDNGHMWLSSHRDGYLYYFDGATFTLHCDSISSITNLVLTGDKLWFMSGGALTFNSPLLTQADLVSLQGGACINHGDLDIHAITKDQEDNFWFVTQDDLNQFDGENIVETIPLDWPIYHVNDYFIDSENRHWLATDLAIPLLHIYDNEEWIYPFAGQIFKAFYELEPGEISALKTDNTYVKFIGYQPQETALFADLSEDSEVLFFENPESIWFTKEERFHTNRLFWSRPDTLIEFMTGDHIIQSTVVDFKQDCAGNLVTASRPFLQRYVDGTWEVIPLATDNEDCYFGRFMDDSFSCEAWLGGGYEELSVASVNDCLSVFELKEDSIYEQELLPQYRLILYRDHIGNIYLTSPNPEVIHKIDTAGIYTTDTVPNAKGDYDLQFLESGTLMMTAVDTNQHLSLRQRENGVWSEFDLSSLAIPDLQLRGAIHKDKEDNLWMAERNGFIKYDGANLSYFPFEVDIPSISIHHNHITDDIYGNFWIATHRNGLVKWTPDSTTIYTTDNSNLLSNRCRELQIIGEDLWVNHYHGITKFKIDAITSSTKAQETKAPQYVLYPNPSSGVIKITNPSLEKRKIDVYTINGVLLTSYNNADVEWCTVLEKGVYFVVIEGAFGVAVERVVVLDE